MLIDWNLLKFKWFYSRLNLFNLNSLNIRYALDWEKTTRINLSLCILPSTVFFFFFFNLTLFQITLNYKSPTISSSSRLHLYWIWGLWVIGFIKTVAFFVPSRRDILEMAQNNQELLAHFCKFVLFPLV